MQAVGNKIPYALKYTFNHYAKNLPEEMTALEKLSHFLFTEAEVAVAAGIFNSTPIQASRSSSFNSKKNARQTKTVHSTQHATASDVSKSSDETKNRYNCVICSKGAHHHSKCTSFVNDSLENRWTIVKSNKLCFNCLRTDHSKEKCQSNKCDQCGASHHKLLHRVKDNKKSKNTRVNQQEGEVLRSNLNLNVASSSVNNSNI